MVAQFQSCWVNSPPLAVCSWSPSISAPARATQLAVGMPSAPTGRSNSSPGQRPGLWLKRPVGAPDHAHLRASLSHNCSGCGTSSCPTPTLSGTGQAFRIFSSGNLLLKRQMERDAQERAVFRMATRREESVEKNREFWKRSQKNDPTNRRRGPTDCGPSRRRPVAAKTGPYPCDQKERRT